MLLQDSLERNAIVNQDKTALIFDDKRFSYREIDNKANSLANALIENGLRKQDRVAICLGNSPETVISLYGILKAGGVFVILNPQMKANKLNYVLNNCQARVLITNTAGLADSPDTPYLKTVIVTDKGETSSVVQPVTLEPLSFNSIVNTCSSTRPPKEVIDIDLASLVYTSGSTGKPKGVMLTHLNMLTAARSIIEYLQNSSNDVIIDVLPLFFDYGLYQIIMSIMFGGTVVLERSFLYPYKIMESMIKYQVTGLPLVPTIAALLLTLRNLSGKNVPNLRYITNTGQSLPPSHITRLRSTFPQVKLFSMYGLTECKRVSYLPPEELDRRPSSVGKAIPNTETYIVDMNDRPITTPWTPGQLVVRGSHVMAGYWGLPEKTSESLRPGRYPNERVLYTGDLFQQDEEGFLYFISRLDDMFKSGGQFVSPKEVENVLVEHEGIIEAAVIGVPDNILGQAVVAFVVVDGQLKMDEQAIITFCSQRLEKHLVPKRVISCSVLPKTSTGKIQKSELHLPE
jgi:long-chain acyl-CoA synthetase